MKLTNNQILNYANSLTQFKDSQIKLPIRANFFLQKNIRLITEEGIHIEEAKLKIGEQYGTRNEVGTGYIIPPEAMADANKELNELLNIEQELPIQLIKLSAFENVELTMAQMSALLFMVEED